MIGVELKIFNGEYKVDCESCGSKISKSQQFCELYLKDIHQTIHICENCFLELKKEMSEMWVGYN